MLLNDLRPVAQRHAHVRETVAPQQIQQPVEHWHADERHHGFRQISGDAAQPPALTAGQQEQRSVEALLVCCIADRSEYQGLVMKEWFHDQLIYAFGSSRAPENTM